MRYQVKAVKSGAGEVVSLVLDARDARDANDQAQAQGYMVVAVRAARALPLPQSFGSARFPLVLFTQELLALLRSGISLLEAIETLTEKESRGATATVLAGLAQRLKQGQSFSSSLQAFPQTFPDLYVATVRASERSGSLPEALGRYVAYQTQLDGVKKHLISASIYPAILIVVGGLVCLFLLGYVVPRFSHIYEDIGGDLPWLTRVLMGWGAFVERYGGLLLGLLVAAIAGLVLWLRQPSAKLWITRQIGRIPAVGERARVYQLTRFYRTVGMLLAGGTPVTQALGMVSGLLDQGLQRRLERATRSIREGRTISVSLDAEALTTPVALRMLRVGERTGQMGEMMERIAAFHEEELARWVERFTRIFEPLLMALIGIVIGGIVVLMYFPIFELAGSMH
ncbi:MAG TPA: type II secretion system F family protein [Burkholderiales bacterium]|nr:type II secretion system F family protein [Burkholderiales bacterium]